MTPMLARTYGPRFDRFPCFTQPKYNGVRALYQAGVWQSRDGKIWKIPILHHLTEQLLCINDKLQGRMLDGELYVHGWKLQRINGAIAVNRNEPNADTIQVEYHVFDMPAHTTFTERWLNQELRLIELPQIKFAPTAIAHNREQLDLQFHYQTSQGYEGLMVRPDGPYELGETPHGTTKRSEYLWKYKSWEDDEFECVGVTQGEGKASIGIGALVCKSKFMDLNVKGLDYKYHTFSCGTGFSDEDRIAYMQNPPIGKLIKVRYLCLSQDGIPLNPSFLMVMP